MESPAAERPVAELVVLNGRQKGNRCPISGPLTLLGRDAVCDVRLNLQEIAPFHVALIAGPVGPILRDLTSEGEILVNGQAVDNRLLHDGDVLTLGPFQFEISLPPGTGKLLPVGPSEEGLRVQAAAVAAEQVRLMELEHRLEQRRLAQETQEKQLVQHLEERHARLETLQQQVKEERQQWRQEREAEEAELARLRGELAQQSEQLDQGRRRLAMQEKAFQERMEVECRAQGEAQAQQKKRLEADRAELDRERAKFAEERQFVADVRARMNTEMELGKRQLREEREHLQLDQQRWEIALNEEEQHRRRRLREVEEQFASLERARVELAEEKAQWRKMRAFAQKETSGLDNRIRAQRAQLAALEREIARHESTLHGRPIHQPVVDLPLSPPTPTAPPAPEEMRELAAHLTDQRLHLAEQWQRLVEQQTQWESERADLIGNLEEAARTLVDRETALTEKTRMLEQLEQTLDQRQSRLEALELNLRLDQVEKDQERATLLAEISQREAEWSVRVVQSEQQVRTERRRSRKILAHLKASRAQLGELHSRLVTLWEAHQEERRKLVPTQQEIVRQRLALEKMRHEVLARAVNVAVAERKLERLEREYVALWAREESDLKAEWQALDRERDLLNELASQKLARLDATLQRVQKGLRLREKQGNRSEERARRRAARQAQLDRLIAERDRAERRATELQAELERIAMNLMGEGPAETPAQESQAA